MPVFVQALRESWRSLLLWAAALVAVMLLYLSFYLSMFTGSGMEQLMAQLPEGIVNAFGFQDISSGAGYAQSTFFGLLGMLLLSAAAISWGTRAIAGDEEAGMLELTLAHRVSRTRVYWQRAASVLVRLVILTVIVGVALLLVNGPFGLEIDTANVLPQLLAYLGTAVVAGAVSLAVGGVTGGRSLALGAGAAVLVGGFLLNAIGNMSPDMEWMHLVSPVSWAYRDKPLLHGWDPAGLAMLYGTAALFAIAGWAVFVRRDIRS